MNTITGKGRKEYKTYKWRGRKHAQKLMGAITCHYSCTKGNKNIAENNKIKKLSVV